MKRVIAIALSVVLILAVSALSFAEERSVPLECVVDAHYIFTIPEGTVSLEKGSAQLPMSFSGGNVDSVQVTVDSTHAFNLVNTDDPQEFLYYKVFDGDEEISRGQQFTFYTGDSKTLTVQIPEQELASAKAGKYTDTFTFTFQ